MAVALRGHQQLAWGASALTWPSGTTAGDLAVVWCDWPATGPSQSGWTLVKWATWWKVLTAADVTAGPGTWAGRLRGLVTMSGARAIGATTTQRGVTVSETGGAALIEGWTEYYTDGTDMTPTGATRLGTSVKGYKDQYCAWWLLTGATPGWRSVAKDENTLNHRSFEILPTKGPSAPTLIGPSGQVDSSTPMTLSWVHNSSASLPQTDFAVRAKPHNDSTWQYIKADGTLSATEVQVASSSTSLTIPSGTLTEVLWDWSVKTSDSGLWSDYATALSITPTDPPTVAPTLTTAAGDLSPLVSWTPTTPGGSQTAWQAAVSADGAGVATALWTSPVTSGAATQTGCPSLSTWTNGADYVSWVRIQQTGGLWSAWIASTAATISWTEPDAPGAIAVADGAPLTITVSSIPASSDVLEVQVSDGVEWTDLASVDLPNATEAVPNPLAPYGTSRTYRARIQKTVDGVLLPSAWVTSSAATSTDTGAYLVSPDSVADYLAVRIREDSTRTLVQGVTTSYGLGATRARTARTPTAGQSGKVTIRTRGSAELNAVISWLSERPTWWLRWPPERDFGWAATDEEPTLMALAEEVEWSRLVQHSLALRAVQFKWVEA